MSCSFSLDTHLHHLLQDVRASSQPCLFQERAGLLFQIQGQETKGSPMLWDMRESSGSWPAIKAAANPSSRGLHWTSRQQSVRTDTAQILRHSCVFILFARPYNLFPVKLLYSLSSDASFGTPHSSKYIEGGLYRDSFDLCFTPRMCLYISGHTLHSVNPSPISTLHIW